VDLTTDDISIIDAFRNQDNTFNLVDNDDETVEVVQTTYNAIRMTTRKRTRTSSKTVLGGPWYLWYQENHTNLPSQSSIFDECRVSIDDHFRGNQFMLCNSLIRMQGDTWLNDENLNFFQQLWNALFPHSYCFSTYFYDFLARNEPTGADYSYEKKAKRIARIRHTTGTPILDRKQLVMMVNWANSHWSLIASDLETKIIYPLDGYHGDHKMACKHMLHFIEDEWRSTSREPAFVRAEWRILNSRQFFTYPDQLDGHSCGLFAILGALMFMRGDSVENDWFETLDMPLVRQILTYFISINVTAADFPQALWEKPS
jgi:Ulp1 family protease